MAHNVVVRSIDVCAAAVPVGPEPVRSARSGRADRARSAWPAPEFTKHELRRTVCGFRTS